MNSKKEDSFNRIAELLIAAREGTRFGNRQRNELNKLLRDSEEHREYASLFLLDGETLQDLLATEEIVLEPSMGKLFSHGVL